VADVGCADERLIEVYVLDLAIGSQNFEPVALGSTTAASSPMPTMTNGGEGGIRCRMRSMSARSPTSATVGSDLFFRFS
jgi:hypothetical protein